MRILKRVFMFVLSLLLLAVFLLVAGISWVLWESREIGAAYSAKLLATGVFVLGRSPESIRNEELRYIPLGGYEIDREHKSVTAWTLPGVRRTAVFREGLGVAVVLDDAPEKVRAQARPEVVLKLDGLKNRPWPMGDAPSGAPRPEGFDDAALQRAVDHMFLEPRRFPTQNTRAVVIAYKGEIIAEKYAPGFGPEQRLAGWSTAKSVFHALVGIAVRDGKIRLSDLAPVPEWQRPGDARAGITLDHLMRMRSGIDYSDFHFVRRPLVGELLFYHSGAAQYFAGRSSAFAPGTHFAYASGSTNLMSHALRQAYGDADYYALAGRELFSKLGMRSATFEADATGTIIGSSFFHATARDYIRFGLLYQNDGVWQGERILPEGWVKYGRTPDPAGPEYYGAHWWLSTGGDRAHAAVLGLKLPDDAFQATGLEGQKLLVIPSMQLVMVRLGLNYFSDFPLYEEFFNVLAAFPGARISPAG